MCFGCITLSAFTLFIPVTDASQPTHLPVTNTPGAEMAQVQLSANVPKFRDTVAQMIEQVSQSPDAEILREELTAIHVGLAGVTDLTQAQEIVDDGMDAMAQRVMAAPNADDLIDLLYDLQDRQFGPQAQLQSSITLLGNSKAWGWLS